MICPLNASETKPFTVVLAVTGPLGSRPPLRSYTFFNSFAVKVTLVELPVACLVNVSPAIVRVTVPPGVTPSTVIA